MRLWQAEECRHHSPNMGGGMQYRGHAWKRKSTDSPCLARFLPLCAVSLGFSGVPLASPALHSSPNPPLALVTTPALQHLQHFHGALQPSKIDCQQPRTIHRSSNRITLDSYTHERGHRPTHRRYRWHAFAGKQASDDVVIRTAQDMANRQGVLARGRDMTIHLES